MRGTVIMAAGIGLGASAAATYRAHRNPMSPEWDERVGDTRLRRSDLPIGGGLALTLALGSLVTGHRKAAAVLAAAGLGATAGSLGVALLEPMPETEPEADDSAAQPFGQQPGEAPPAAGVETPAATESEFQSEEPAVASEAEPEGDEAFAVNEPLSGAPETPEASESEPVEPSSPMSDMTEDDSAEQQLEQATEAVEHQASYGSPSFDELPADSGELSEPEVTGSAPQEGQESPDTRSDDKDA